MVWYMNPTLSFFYRCEKGDFNSCLSIKNQEVIVAIDEILCADMSMGITLGRDNTPNRHLS